MSIAGGYYKAINAAVEAGCDCVQIFTKNNNQWRAKPITDAEAERFRETFEQSPLTDSLAHASYLINMASPKDDLRDKSIEAMRVELRRAEQLGVPFVVVHPGAFTDSSEEEGIARISDAMNEIHDAESDCSTVCLLETTAGQGTCLGWRFEHLAEMLDGIDQPERMGICLDTCHVFAAGYSLSPDESYQATMNEFDHTVGLDQLKAIHLNDSKKDLGSRVDRHEHIGDGHLGLEPFKLLLNDDRLSEVPMYLETEKKDAPDGRAWDVVNLERLRGLLN